MFAGAYLDTALFLIDAYTGGGPFHLFLKGFFARQKKFGARDRRQIAQLCYCWFRAGHALKHLERKQQLVYALFLCAEGENGLLQKLDADLYAASQRSIAERLQTAVERIPFQASDLFPWNKRLSPRIDTTAFNKSLLIQPNLYLRLRPGKEALVKTALQQHDIAFETVSPSCLSLNNSVKVDGILDLDRDAVVQDRNSQRTLELVAEHGGLKKFAFWDCCAASGGKSLLLLDTFPAAHATVSDVRETILHNLRQRFGQAGIKTYRWFIGDAVKEAPPRGETFELVICDAPCSGSGTWGRTPEQLHHFKPEKTATYATLQKSIVQNVSNHVKPGGLLLYITCSVFTEENEDVVTHIRENTNLNFLKSAYYTGYDIKADTLFVSLFQAS